MKTQYQLGDIIRYKLFEYSISENKEYLGIIIKVLNYWETPKKEVYDVYNVIKKEINRIIRIKREEYNKL